MGSQWGVASRLSGSWVPGIVQVGLVVIAGYSFITEEGDDAYGAGLVGAKSS